MIRSGLGRVVGRARTVRGLLGEDLVRVEREIAVHLAGRDVVEPRYARRPSCLEQRLRPEHVRPEEPRRVDDREAVVRLGREVDDGVDPLLAKRLLGELAVADVSLHEDDPVLDRREALPVAGVGQQVVGDDVVVRMLLEPVVDEVRADEAGRAGDEKSHGQRLASELRRDTRAGPRASAEERARPRARCAGSRAPGGAPGDRAPRSRSAARDSRSRRPRRSPRRTPPTCSRPPRRRARFHVVDRRPRARARRAARCPTKVGQPRWSSTTATSSPLGAEPEHRPYEVVARRPEEPRATDDPGIRAGRRLAVQLRCARTRRADSAPSDSTYGSRLRPSKT